MVGLSKRAALLLLEGHVGIFLALRAHHSLSSLLHPDHMGQQTSRQLNVTGLDVGGLARASISSLTQTKRERHGVWFDNKIAKLLKVPADKIYLSNVPQPKCKLQKAQRNACRCLLADTGTEQNWKNQDPESNLAEIWSAK